MSVLGKLAWPAVGIGGAAARWLFGQVVAGRITIDLGWGRRVRPLGPFDVEVAATRETVFDVISQPYLGRSTRAMADKLQVLERGSDMVLAEHYTPVGRGYGRARRGGKQQRAVTVETVRFDRPERVTFRLLRGPVPHVLETFELTEHDGSTTLSYRGELGTDGGRIGAAWGDVVAAKWEGVVRASFASVTQEAERRASHGTAASPPSGSQPSTNT